MRRLSTVLSIALMPLVLAACTSSVSATSDEWKIILGSIPALFVLLNLASIANALKQLGEARKNGTPMALTDYLTHWTETLYTFLMNVLAFVGLIAFDQLTEAAPLGLKLAAILAIGFGTNSLSDVLTKGGRSQALVTPEDKR